MQNIEKRFPMSFRLRPIPGRPNIMRFDSGADLLKELLIRSEWRHIHQKGVHVCVVDGCSSKVSRYFSCPNRCQHLVCESHFKKLLGEFEKASVETCECDSFCFVLFYESEFDSEFEFEFEDEDEETESDDLYCTTENNHTVLMLKEQYEAEQDVE
jgi:hypothetical protein